MTPFASVAVFNRNGTALFKPPRKERSEELTQARKSAMRHWRNSLAKGDTLLKVLVVREFSGRLEISERAHNGGSDRPWVFYVNDLQDAAKDPPQAACLTELGINAERAAAPLPDVLEINGVIYRREI